MAGLKLSDREHTAVTSDFSGNILADHSVAREALPTTLNEMPNSVKTLLDRVCQKAGVTRRDWSGIGIGVPGFVDHAEGMVHWSSTLCDRTLPLAAAAQQRLGLPATNKALGTRKVRFSAPFQRAPPTRLRPPALPPMPPRSTRPRRRPARPAPRDP